MQLPYSIRDRAGVCQEQTGFFPRKNGQIIRGKPGDKSVSAGSDRYFRICPELFFSGSRNTGQKNRVRNALPLILESGICRLNRRYPDSLGKTSAEAVLCQPGIFDHKDSADSGEQTGTVSGSERLPLSGFGGDPGLYCRPGRRGSVFYPSLSARGRSCGSGRRDLCCIRAGGERCGSCRTALQVV